MATGSDETVLPLSIANAIGLQLDFTLAGYAFAVGGHVVELVPGPVTLEMREGNEIYRWQTLVSFCQAEQPDDEVALLGYAGFLEFFTVSSTAIIRSWK